jgi:quercetin dioxygenase-like cupin family protein
VGEEAVMRTPVRAATSGLVVSPGGGTRLALARSAPLVKFARRDGAERLAALESDLAPGGGFAYPHWHEDFDEVFYVLEGSIDYLTGEAWTTAPAGSIVFVPSGVVHAFRNSGSDPARHLVVVSPAEGLELIEALAQRRPNEFHGVFERYGSHLVQDPPHFPQPESSVRDDDRKAQ